MHKWHHLQKWLWGAGKYSFFHLYLEYKSAPFPPEIKCIFVVFFNGAKISYLNSYALHFQWVFLLLCRYVCTCSTFFQSCTVITHIIHSNTFRVYLGTHLAAVLVICKYVNITKYLENTISKRYYTFNGNIPSHRPFLWREALDVIRRH